VYTDPEASCFNKSSSLAAPLGITKLTSIIVLNLVTLFQPNPPKYLSQASLTRPKGHDRSKHSSLFFRSFSDGEKHWHLLTPRSVISDEMLEICSLLKQVL
jgi:hypothetical protein